MENGENRMTIDVGTRVFKTIDEIGKDAINSLVDDPFFTYGWLRTLETSNPPIKLDPFYVTVYNDGKLAGFTPCFRDLAGQYFQYGPQVIPFMKKSLTLGNRLRIGQNHVLLCYSPWCFRTKVFSAEEQNEQIIRSLSAAIDSICKMERIWFSSFLFVSEFDKDLMATLEKLGYHKFFWKNTLYIKVEWKNLDEYIKFLRTEFRHQVKKEIKSCFKNGITIEVVSDFKKLSRILSDLSYEQTTKYNKWAQRLEPSFYETLYECAKDNVVVFLAKRHEEIIGFTLFIRKDNSADGFIAGFDYSLQKKSDFTYFNLAYYAPIKWAIEQGIQKIYYRWGSEDAKYKRGCKPEKIYSFVKSQNRLLNSQINNFALIKNKMRRFF